MKSKILPLFLFISSLIFSQNTPTILSGKVIGSANFYDYVKDRCFTDSVSENAFDGDLQNTFATCDRSGGWIGLDLGEPYIISQVAYCPRASQPGRMQLGLFEGANSPDFGDAIPLFLIGDNPATNRMTYQPIQCTKGFRYLRYIGPSGAKCNVAEIEFYGNKGVGNSSYIPQITQLPTISIHTVDAQQITDRETYIYGIISIISENGTNIFSDSTRIRGRGNASWTFPKKPYKFKLHNKARLLDFPAKEKSWTLINNYGDKTLMRNLVAFHISEKLEMPYTPAGRAVDVVLNGEYKGTYQLCDHVEVGDDRVNVETMKATDIELPTLAGGYLVEMDAYAYDDISWFNSQLYRIPVTIKYPKDDKIVPAQSAYIQSHFEQMERALDAYNYRDAKYGYRKYIDVPSMIRQFLVGEITGNTDTYWSTYMYKKRNEDLLYFAPSWDFDIALENDARTYPINSYSDWICFARGSWANGVRSMMSRIFTDPAFNSELSEIYAYYRNAGLISESDLLSKVDELAAEINDSQKLNFIRWNMLNSRVHQNPRTYGSYQGEVDNVKSFLRNRIKWMDHKLNYIASAVETNSMANIYLNQNGNTISIEGISDESGINIYDIAGRIILSDKINAGYTTTLNQGMYIIQIADAVNGNKTLKCMIQ